MLAFTLIPGHLGMSVEGRQRTVKEVAMTKMVLITAALIAGIGFAVAQGQVPGNKSEAATPRAARTAERAAGQGHTRPFELAQCRPSGRQGGS
jgi:hypothetical protein